MFELAVWELALLSAAVLIVVSLLVRLAFHYRRRLVQCRTECLNELENLRANLFTGLARDFRATGTATGSMAVYRHPEEERPNGKPSIPATEDNRSNAAFINKLVLAVGSHLDDSAWFPAGLAREMCLSESQLNRKLKAMTGHTICSFLMWMRLDRAKQMLSGSAKGASEISIKEVAYGCGFNSLPYFSRSFKAEFGVSPSQFAQEN